MPGFCQCGKPLTGRQRKWCTACVAYGLRKNAGRVANCPEMFVSIDLEGKQTGNDMCIITASYGREDGTSNSIYGHIFTGQEIIQWLIDELSGHYTDSAGQEWRQTTVSFHFNWDSSVIAKDFKTDLMLIHSATARKNQRNRLCATEHNHFIAQCGKIDRHSQEMCQQIISSGGEEGLIAYESVSKLGIAITPKRRFYAEYRPEADLYKDNKRIDIHDTGTAFVGTLLNVIDNWHPELTKEQADIIEWGKQARKNGFLQEKGTPAPISKIVSYSEAECIAHARCCRKLIDTIRIATGIIIHPHQLFGSGSIAKIAFKYHKVPTRLETHRTKTKISEISIEDIGRLCYFGGIIESPTLGWTPGPIDIRDLNSAYPAQAIKLPCMRHNHGEWKHKVIKFDPIPKNSGVGYAKVSWACDTISTPPFIVRRKDGLVRQPLTGQDTWVTLQEYNAAIIQFPTSIITHEIVWWECTCDCGNPLAFLETFYDERAEVKKKMKTCKSVSEWNELHAIEQVLKLIINSAYGILAQQRPVLGRYTNFHYASYITGGTRANVRLQSWQQESSNGRILYQHTDSVISIGGNPENGTDKLGEWGAEPQIADLLTLQPGLAISVSGGKVATRGCGKSDFILASLKWLETTDLTKPPQTWPKLHIARTMMISRRMAIARGKPELAGAFIPQPLTIQFNTGKRNVESAYRTDIPTMWMIPPIEYEPFVATAKDLKVYQDDITEKINAGEYDWAPGEITYDDIQDGIEEVEDFAW